jgi:phage recombination protein Bet
MAAAQTSRAAPQPAPPAPSQPSLVDQLLETFEYTPFMAKDPITLNARLVLKYLCKPTKSGKYCTEADAVRFCMLCKARGLNPWEGDAYIVGYDSHDGPEFNLITAHQAFLKRAEVHPDYDGMQSGVTVRREWIDADSGAQRQETLDLEGDYFEEGDALVGGWARVHFKKRGHPMYRRVKLATFNKGFSRWKTDPAGMICKVAEAHALRDSFPNSLGGLYLDGEFRPESEQGERPPEPPRAGRHHLGNGHGHGHPAPPDRPAEDTRTLESARELAAELGARLELAETRKDLEAVGADALGGRDRLGEPAYRTFLAAYQQKFAALAEPAAREPGEED